MQRLRGIVASNGIAIGPVFRYQPASLRVQRRSVSDVEAEAERFIRTRDAVASALDELVTRMGESDRAQDAEIFEIQREFLEDPSFGEAIPERIREEGINAEAAVEGVARDLAEEFGEIEDEYFAQRATDVQDLATRMLRHLSGITEDPLAALREPSVIIAPDLTPSDTASLSAELALALVTEAGSATSHTAILARGMGIPALVGLGPVPHASGTAIVDALEGELMLDPEDALLVDAKARQADYASRRERLLARAFERVHTEAGEELEIAANIGTVNDARQAVANGADGVGLLRTEFLFLDRPRLPSEEEQLQAYRDIGKAMGGRPIVIRTLDVGGDKRLPSVELPAEQNPFLGQRAIRLAFAHPEKLLFPQLRAILRAAAEAPYRIMFPMIASLPELLRAKDALAESASALKSEGVDYNAELEVGIMVEIPATAVAADLFAPHVDFFSIGTNDLTQYTLAVDRTNEQIAELADYCNPAVLRLIRGVIRAGRDAGKWVGMCGEMAGDPLAIPLLLGMGLQEYSMSPSRIPDAKDRIRHLPETRCADLAEEACTLPDAKAVRSLVRDFLAGLD